MYALVLTACFTRAFRKFVQYLPELRTKSAEILCDLEADPFQPHLTFHLLTVMVIGKGITLLDIGSHDEVYR
jgi:hypothetical protein